MTWRTVQDATYAAAIAAGLDHRTIYTFLVMDEPPAPWGQVAARAIAAAQERHRTWGLPLWDRVAR